MGRWTDAATWTGDGLRREVFFFGPEGSELYGSLYSAVAPSRDDGVVVCSSWGFEADHTEHLAHHLALTMARQGGAGMVFHYPGYGDSRGACLDDATMEGLAGAAVTALAEASRRQPHLKWFPAGLMIGAAVACMAQHTSAVAADRLLLIQPALRPSDYFGDLAGHAQRVQVSSGRIREMSFAYPLPRRIVDAGPEADVAVEDALERFEGEGAVVRQDRPGRDELVPGRFTDVAVDGVWRFAARVYPELEHGVAEWLRAS